MHPTRNPRLAVVVLVVFGLVPVSRSAQDPEPEPPKLLGRCTVGQLEQEPFDEWFRAGYDAYEPNPDVVTRLSRVDRDSVRFTIFFGTWCGDSRREVPHWLKLLDTIGFSADRVDLIAVDAADGAHKRSPGREEEGREIYRVPTVLVMRGGDEIGRVVEYPVRSVERDLLLILEGGAYSPSYATYPVIRGWLRDGLLADPNVSVDGLADALRPLVSTEGELAAAARVLLSRGDTSEAVRLFRVNCALHRESPACLTRLADALARAGEGEQAAAAAERALSLGPEPELVKTLAEILRETAEP